MKVSQIVFALSSAATVSYYAYIYANVSLEHFQKVSSFIHGAALVGKFSGYLLGQVFFSLDVMDLYYLNVITFVDMCFGFVLSLVLPRAGIPEVLYQQYRQVSNESHSETLQENKPSVSIYDKLKCFFAFIKQELRGIYSSRSVRTWSIWWALASCGYFQVSTYIQNMWATIAPHRENRKLYNGAVEAAGTLLGKLIRHDLEKNPCRTIRDRRFHPVF